MIYFVGFLGVVAVALWFLIPNVWAPAWQEEGFANGILAVIVGPLPVLNYAVVYAFLVGIFLGLSALWLVDDYKRPMGVVLWFGIIVSTFLFWQHWLNPLTSPVWVSIVIAGLGVLGGAQAGGLPMYSYFFGEKKALLRRAGPSSFEKAIRLISGMVVLLVVTGLLDGFAGATQGANNLIVHFVAIVLIAVPLVMVQRYEDSERIIQLGPSKSGKTSTQGGLYMSLDDKIESRSQLLQSIYKDHMRNGKFPDRTRVYTLAETESATIPLANGGTDDEQDDGDDSDSMEDALLLEFSYLTNDLLFPKEKIITAVDYPGELLTDIGEQDNSISDYVATHVEKIESGETEDLDWDEVIEILQQGGDDGLTPGEFEEWELMSYIAHLVRTADHVMFTIPLDDFLGPVVADRSSNLPTYHRNAVWEIRETDKEAEAAYETKRLTASDEEWVPLAEQSQGKYLPAEGQPLPGFNPNKEAWLGGDDFYYYRMRRERIPPKRYLNEYRDILEALPDLRDYHFVWMATMADLLYEDFASVLRRTREYTLSSATGGEAIDVHESDGRINVGRSDIDIGLLEEGLFETNKPVRAESDRQEYRLFSTWILEECLLAEEPAFDSLLNETSEEFVFPVWFDIEDEDEERFSTIYPALKGTQQITARLRGEILKKAYSGGRLTTLRAGLSSASPVSDTLMAYQILDEVRDEEAEK